MAKNRLLVGIHDSIDPALLVPAERDLVTGRIATGPRRGDKDRPDSRDAVTRVPRRVWPVALGVVGAVVVASSAAALAVRDPEPAPRSAASASASSSTSPTGVAPSAGAVPPAPPGSSDGLREYRVVSYTMTTGAVTGVAAQTTTAWDRGTVSMRCSGGRCTPIWLPQFPEQPASVPSSDGTHPYKVLVEVLENDGCAAVSRVATGTVTFSQTSMRTTGTIPGASVSCTTGRIEYGSTSWTLVGALLE